MVRYVLGIDGGGTGTRAAILDLSGHLCGQGESGSSNYDDVGVAAARAAILEAVTRARREAGLGPAPFVTAFLGLGGIASQADRDVILGIASDLALAPAGRIGVDHDIRIALAGGLSGRPGIVLIAGTGSSCYGRNSAGESWRSGGWGPLVADEGSGYWLGIESIKAAVRAYDGRAEPTVLLPRVQAALALPHMDDLLRHLYVRGMPRMEIAALGPVVIQAAQEDDATATAILGRGCQELADCVLAVARWLGMADTSSELALTGGVFRAGEVVIGPLRQAVADRLPKCRVGLAECAPVMGAALLALELLGILPSAGALEALRQTIATGSPAPHVRLHPSPTG
jgi:N-acetylglucosamine kinase-like BadF-type ATPase